MSIELFAWDTPNARKITVALEEMNLAYTVTPVNLHNKEQFTSAFLAISPNNKIPAIIDRDSASGEQVSVFESGAILLYLAEKSGCFLPSSGKARVSVLEWLMWQMGGLGPMPGQVHHFLAVKNGDDRRYGLSRFVAETKRLYGVLNARLAHVEFVGGELSIADFAILGWVWRHPKHQVTLADFPHVGRWYETLMARPATKRGFEVPLDK